MEHAINRPVSPSGIATAWQKPADLPVVQSSKLDLVIERSTIASRQQMSETAATQQLGRNRSEADIGHWADRVVSGAHGPVAAIRRSILPWRTAQFLTPTM
jgi:hypothetical protein